MKLDTLGKWIALVSLLLMGCAARAQQPAENTVVPLTNGDFESGAANWSMNEKVAMSQIVPEAAHSGKMGLRVVDQDEKLGSSAFSARVSVTAGQTYRLNFWAKTQTEGAAGVFLWFTDANRKNVATDQSPANLKKGDDWKPYHITALVPATATTMCVWVHTYSTAKTTLDLDDFSLELTGGPTSQPLAATKTTTATPTTTTATIQRVRKSPAYIVLKLDDLVKTGTGVSDRWKRVADFIKQRKIKATIGIICNSLEGDNPEYVQWIKQQQATGLIEFWNHGYTHKAWKENGQDVQEFKGTSYEAQLEALQKTEALAREKLGFPLTTFGAPFNATDENTSKALLEIKEINVWLYGEKKNPAGKLVLDRVGEVNIENPLFTPSLDKFIAGYNKYTDRDYFVIQGHANQWDDARFDQFVKIVDFLTEQKAIFVTPSEYAELKEKPRSALAPLPPNPVAQLIAAQTAVAQPQSLVSNGDFSAPLQNNWTVGGKSAPTPAIVETKIEGTHLTRALQLNLAATQESSPWDVRLAAPETPSAITKNDLILVQFWARSTPKTRLVAVFQQSTAPYGKTMSQTATVQPQWQKFTFYAPSKGDYPAGGSNFELQLGQATGQLELAGLNVQNVGALSVAEAKVRFGAETIDYYGGEDHNDSWLPAAQARIEKYRKADFKIRVVDQSGKTIKGAQVALKQTKSAFRWGTAVNYRVLEQSPDGDIYRAQLKRLFNTAVLENDLKWRSSDGNPAVQARAVATLDWLHTNGFGVRGHTLVWGNAQYIPDSVKDFTPDALRVAVENRVTEAVTLNKGKVYVWDVVNEAGSNTQLWDKIGWASFSGAYRRARATDPNLLLAYNDYNISNEAPDNGRLRRKVEARIQTLIDSGAPLDILGDQAHMSVPLTTIPRVLQIWDEWGKKYQKPLEITEFDANVADDTVHEKYVRDYLTAAFSNPNIQSFLVWGFWAKAHFLGEPGSLFRADWSPRPAALAYEDLVLNKWRTNQTLTTDAAGNIQTRGFLGDYEVQISAGGKTRTLPLSLDKAGLQKDVVLQ